MSDLYQAEIEVVDGKTFPASGELVKILWEAGNRAAVTPIRDTKLEAMRDVAMYGTGRWREKTSE
jgi:hypothetical protein